jgi:mxaJ protein
VWGPVAGFFARGRPAGLTVSRVVPDHEGTLPFAFDIAVGVRRGPQARPLLDRLDWALREERQNIERILNEYGVPRS